VCPAPQPKFEPPNYLILAADLLKTLASNDWRDMNNFSFRRRVFLASVSTSSTSYVLAEVESSQGGEYRYGHYMLSLADCRRRIELEFSLGSARSRRQSVKKLDLLINVLNAFRQALVKEAELIAGYERGGKSAQTTKRKT
jgi:hypothetical protein